MTETHVLQLSGTVSFETVFKMNNTVPSHFQKLLDSVSSLKKDFILALVDVTFNQKFQKTWTALYLCSVKKLSSISAIAPVHFTFSVQWSTISKVLNTT